MHFVVQSVRQNISKYYETLLKEYSDISIFLSILRNFSEQFLGHTLLNECSCKYKNAFWYLYSFKKKRKTGYFILAPVYCEHFQGNFSTECLCISNSEDFWYNFPFFLHYFSLKINVSGGDNLYLRKWYLRTLFVKTKECLTAMHLTKAVATELKYILIPKVLTLLFPELVDKRK